MSIRTALLPKQNVQKYFYLLRLNLLRRIFKLVLDRMLNIPVLQIQNISCLMTDTGLAISIILTILLYEFRPV